MLPIDKLEKLVGEPDSGIEKERQAVHVALHPKYVNSVPLGLVNHFNKLINQYHPDLKGILAGYGRLQLRKPTGCMINDEAHMHLDVQSDFWIFRPLVGRQLKGVVSKKSQTHVSVLVHGVFNVPCHRPNNIVDSRLWFGTKAKLKQVVHLTVLKTDMSQKVPFILGTLQNIGLDDHQVTFDETAPSPSRVEELSDQEYDQLLDCHPDTNKSVLSNEETSQKSKKKKSKAENTDKMDTDSNSDDIEEQRKKLITSVLDSSILNDSTASSSSGKKNKKKKRKEAEKDKDEEAVEAKETVGSSMILNESTLTTSPKKSKKKKKDKDKEKELEEANNLIDSMNSSINGPEKKKKNKKDKNRSRSPSPDLVTPITEKPSPKKSPKKSPVKEAKTKLNSIAENTTGKKNVPKSVASPASKNKKDPNAPKAPLTSYFLFTAEQRLKVKAENPALPVTEIAKILGQRWKEIDPETKERYTKMAEDGKKKYDIEMAAYKENNVGLAPVNDKSSQGKKSSKNVPKSVASPASKTKKDPNAPKLPSTAWFLFSADERAKVKAEDPSLSFGDIAKLIGQRWKEVDSEDKKRYEKMAEEGKKKYDIDMAAYKEGNYKSVQNNENHEPVNDKSMELNEKKKKKDKKRPRSPSPEIAKKSPSSSPVKESKRKAEDEPVTSPVKKKSRKNISFETSTPIRLEENNHTKNNNDCSINDEPKKKKSKKKDKDKDNTEMARNSLIDNLKKKYNK